MTSNTAAVLYVDALDELTRRTWDELRIPGATASDRPRGAATPSSMVLTELLTDPKSPWWDDRSTKNVVEDRDMILRASLLAAYQHVVKKYGVPATRGAGASALREHQSPPAHPGALATRTFRCSRARAR